MYVWGRDHTGPQVSPSRRQTTGAESPAPPLCIIEDEHRMPSAECCVLMSKSFAISIVRTLRDGGHQAYLVGGCVRDLVLGREPADYDVATNATPDEVMRIFPETYAVGAQFGVVLVPVPKAEQKSVIPSVDGTSRSEVSSESRNLLLGSSHADAIEVATFRS